MSRPGNAPINRSINEDAPTRLTQVWQGWFTNLAALFSNTSAVTLPAVTASPFIYQNRSTSLQQAIVTGTVTSISFSRDGTNYYIVTGPVTISQNDYLKIIYPAAAPVLILSPL